jgi:hypothetical protein
VTVLDGVDAGKSTTTNGNGEYRFESLTIANANFTATATGFQEDRRGTFINGTNTLNFTLPPAPPPPPTLTIQAREKIRSVGYAEWAFVAVPSAGAGTFRTFSWDFGDGGGATNSPLPEEAHNYFASGDYVIRVTGTAVGSSTPHSASTTIHVIVE